MNLKANTKIQKTKKNKFWAGILLAQILLFYFLSGIPAVVSFFENFFEFQKKTHQKLFADLSFSLGDILYTITGIYIFILLIKSCKKKHRSNSIRTFLIVTNVLYFLYQIFWGMLYFQNPILSPDKTDAADLIQTKLLAHKYLKKCIETRKNVSEDLKGIYTIKNINTVISEIVQTDISNLENIKTKKNTKVQNVKPSICGSVMNFTGISGYYNPFTAEAQFNSQMPATQIPFTIAHEIAHQQGYAREQEASFIGYLHTINSNNPNIRYSAELYVLKSLLRSIQNADETFVKDIISSYSPAMMRDRDAELKFYQNHAGFVEEFFGFTNDLFLKSNQQQGSITYSYFVNLLLHYEAKKESR